MRMSHADVIGGGLRTARSISTVCTVVGLSRDAAPGPADPRPSASVLGALAIGPFLVALSQVPQIPLIGAAASSALWLLLSRQGLTTRVFLVLGALTGLGTAVLTTLFLVVILHRVPEIYQVPSVGTMRIMGSAAGVVAWPVVGAIVTTFFAGISPNAIPVSFLGRALWAAGWIAIGTVLSIFLGTIVFLGAYSVLGTWSDD
jgi:hypothetical protein